MIKAKDIYHTYGDLQVLKGIDLNINQGEFVSIIGESGAGKTTLLHILGTLENLQKGTLEINNTNINNLSEKELAKIRNTEIGFVFQFHNLLEELSAIENICLPALIKGEPKMNVMKEAHKLLKLVNLSHRKEHSPSELSGGEQQRVAVARALINKPSIILADEPTGNLDSKNAEELHDLFLKLNLEQQQTFIIITHNEKLANQTNRQIKIKDGKII